MANEIRVSTSGDLLTANILAKELELLLHQKPFALDLMTYRGDVRGSGSDTIKVRQIDQDDIGVVVAEGASIAGNTALTDASYTITPARIAIKRTFSDLMGIVDSTGLIDEVALARYNFMAIMKGLHALFATATQSLTGTAGTTGVDMSASDFFVAQQALQSRKANGRVICHLHQEQFNNLQTDLRGEVGPWQLVPAVQEALAFKGDNYKGLLNGVEIWTSDQAPDVNAGADHGGAMFVKGAIAYAQGSAKPVQMRGRSIAPGGVIYTDVDMNVDSAEESLVTNGFFGVSVAQADMGIKIITDHA
jgi:hypothetical protein